MQEIFITLILFGLAVLLGFTRSKPNEPEPAVDSDTSMGDRAPTASQPTVNPTTEAQPIADSAVQPVAETPPTPAAASNAPQSAPSPMPLLELESDVTLPLAASLPLQEAINPEILKVDTVPDLFPNSSSIIEAIDERGSQTAPDRDHQSVLEEIAHLDEADHDTAIASLTQQATHPDSLVRATAAMALGELATQGQPQDEIVALLHQLLQDSNSEVRLQAAAALGKMQSAVDLT